MKTNYKIFFAGIVIVCLYFLIFAGINSNSEINFKLTNYAFSSANPKDFVNCIFNDAYEAWNHQAWILKFLDRYKDSLHFNTLHYYNYSVNSPDTAYYYDKFNSLMTSTRIQHNLDLLDSVEDKGLKTLTARQNIGNYTYGQRLIYEVSQSGSTTLNDGFCYQNVMADTYTSDSGRTVLHAVPWPHDYYNSPGYLCKNIYENLQHTDIYDFVQRDAGYWYLKPMMRIDSAIFDISNTTPVVAIVAVNYLGNPIDSIVVRVNNFRKNNQYKGQYINTFTFDPLYPDSLITSGNDSTGLGNGRNDDFRHWANDCKVDFRVYWFGEIEVWFDNLIVDDEIARRLFNPTDQEINIDTLIKQEVSALGDHPANFAFFTDEVSYSNYRCINYIDSIMKTVNPNAKLHTAVTNYFSIRGFKNNSVGESAYYRHLHPNSFNPDAHLFDFVTKLPNNFNYYDERIPPSTISSNYTEYNNCLQNAAFGDRNSISPENVEYTGSNPVWWGSLVYQIVLARKNRDLYSPNSQFIMQPQIHTNAFISESDRYFRFGNREPTNEEIQGEAMLSIAHGAEGLCWFIYPSIKSVYNSGTQKNYYEGIEEIESSETTFVYNYGLTKLLQDYPSLPPRDSNMYGQNKWDYVKKMNIKIEHWKPTLDQIEFDSGFSVHSEGANHNYISDIKSIIVHTNPPTPCASDVNYECPENTYWEMGFFNPDFDNELVNVNEKSKYFIMVNRRCYPDVNNNGDLRQLKIKFDSTDLSGFRNWEIIDLDSNHVIRTFDKDSAVYVDMRIFKPGEGKLYKLAPVMQEGGTLVANENVAGQEFVCNSMVYNGGNDVYIKNGTTIHFKTGAGIFMNGGNFNCANDTSSHNDIFLNGFSSQEWNGIVLNNCGGLTRIENTKFYDTKSPIRIDNDNIGSAYNSKIIRRNFFDIDDNSKAIYVHNQYYIWIDSNTFHISSYDNTVAVYYLNNLILGPEAAAILAEAEQSYNINITNNFFSGGMIPVLINGLGTNYSIPYIYNNKFESTGLYGIAGLKISGAIKQNTFINSSEIESGFKRNWRN